MKTAIKGLGIAVLAVMFVFAFVGCKEAEDTSTASASSGGSNSTGGSTSGGESTPGNGTTPGNGNTVIKTTAIVVTAPVKGATPSTTANGTGNFTIGTVSWLPHGTNLFLGNTVYTALVTLTANSGYTFTGLTSATINGQNAALSNNTGSAVTLSHTFPATETRTVTKITIKTQPNNLTYTHGDTLDLTGLVVTLTHDDTTTEDVVVADFAVKNVTANPAHNNLIYINANGQPITITYGNLTRTTNNLVVNNATPIAADYNISGIGTFTYDGNAKTVTITPKEGKSTGTITIKYGSNNTNAPSTVGTYNIAFDVAEAIGFNAVSGLSVGTMTIGNATPTAADYDISGTGIFNYDGSAKTVTITPKEGKSTGAITVKYNGNTNAPSTVNTYNITFDVAAATNYNAANGLSAGTLTINKATPTVEDFNIIGTGSFYYDGNFKSVTITPKEGKSYGIITVKYNGSTTAPSAVGIYTVTFDVAVVTSYNSASGLSAGTLTINNSTVIFNSVTANGSASQSTTQLTLTFDKEINGLTAADITLSGKIVIKGILSGSNPYTLPISGFTSGGTLSVAVAKSGYTINDSPKTVNIYYKLVIDMVQIPGGSFAMGNNDYNTNENPVHTVTLSNFYMGKYEVTQEQWTTVMGSNPSNFKDSPVSGEVQNKRPVEYVSWYDALVFCNKLSMLEGLSPAYRISGSTDPAVWGTVPTNSNSTWNAVEIVTGSNGYRLPTEAQWEYAARGGKGSPGNYTYSGSNNLGDVAWYPSNSGDKTHEVGKKTPNGLGLYDMSGNVMEWCWDRYGSYSSGAQTDPMGAATSSSYRVDRGGSWGNSMRSTERTIDLPDFRDDNLGFRLVRP